MTKQLRSKLEAGQQQDNNLLVPKDQAGNTLGHNPDYLDTELGITKSDLIRLERGGMALKARYDANGTHRTRWIIFKEALE